MSALKKYLAKNDTEGRFKGALPDKRLATVAVMHGKHVLMGKRRDNGRWTTPGGHAEDDEPFHLAAVRELEEESGIKAHHSDLTQLGPSKTVKTDDGKTIEVQPYKYRPRGRPATSMKEDPDAEVTRWTWVDCSKGLPKHVRDNLHVPMHKNALLPRLGLN